MKEQQVIQMDMYTTVAVICDRCGRRAETGGEDWGRENGPIEAQEYVHIEIRGGYGSVFGDGEHHELDLCQRCAKEILGPYLRHTGGRPSVTSIWPSRTSNITAGQVKHPANPWFPTTGGCNADQRSCL